MARASDDLRPPDQTGALREIVREEGAQTGPLRLQPPLSETLVSAFEIHIEHAKKLYRTEDKRLTAKIKVRCQLPAVWSPAQ